MTRTMQWLLVGLTLSLVGCTAENLALSEAADETGLNEPLGVVPEEATQSSAGPTVPAGAATEVWAVRNNWSDRDTADARRAGVAWGENSGLTWEQKYERWIASFRKIERTGYGSTFELTTPHGNRRFPAPTLECAETGMFLRLTFASWYGLPFFLQGWSSTDRAPLYAGHFGFVLRSGARARNFPLFKTQYRDYSATWREGMAWPTDARLRSYRLGDDDAVPFLQGPNGGTAGAGTYFDEIFLNKRVGYFARLILLYFGSANLADGNNMYHVRPLNTSPGDLLVERWQRSGIGHVLPVVRVATPAEGRIAVDVVSGSMPRRQPLWDDPSTSLSYFTAEYTGGTGNADDGTPYARLGGGIRRWRTAVLRSGRWMNEVLPDDEAAYIPDSDTATIAARPEQFRDAWQMISPEERRQSTITRIENARRSLRMYPASCSNRTRREEAFDELYQISAESFNMDRAAVDARYRLLEDYVFAELEYTRSKTCCWNSTTSAMAEIVLDYANQEQARARTMNTCVNPTVFRNEGGSGDGYDRWRMHAASMGRSAQWVAWREDEPCMQRSVSMDTGTSRGGNWCPRPR